MKLTIDFETRSTVDLRKTGAWKYAEHPSTEVIWLSVKWKGDPSRLWLPPKFKAMLPADHGFNLLDDDHVKGVAAMPEIDTIEGHNVEFERAIWHHIMHKRHGFPDLPLAKLRCSAAKAAMHGLPRDLANAAKAMDVAVQKDQDGHRLMLKMCKPRKGRKDELEGMTPNQIATTVFWHEDPADIVRLGQYCMQDTDAEHALSASLRDLPPREQEVWHLDQKINRRGISVDLTTVHAMLRMIDHFETILLAEFKKICPFSPGQVASVLGWLEGRGVILPNLQKQTVIDALEMDNLPADTRRVLELRQVLGKASNAKYKALVNMTCADGRMRGLLMYHGARTGRWAGKGIQVHNLPSRGVIKELELAIEYVLNEQYDLIEMMWDNPMHVASSCVRPMLVAEGHKNPNSTVRFFCADFAAIEARVNAWIAGEAKLLDVFRTGGSVYRVAAADVYHKPIEEITKDERQIGKVIILACFTAETPVLTDVGWVPIAKVTDAMRVWDGCDFTTHDGVVCQGEKSVVDFLGIKVTEDHKIQTGRYGWQAAADLNVWYPLLRSALDLAASSLPTWSSALAAGCAVLRARATAELRLRWRKIICDTGEHVSATHARNKHLLRATSVTRTSSPNGRTDDESAIVWRRLCADAPIQLTPTTRGMEVEVSGWTRFGWRTEPLSSHTLRRCLGGLTLFLRSIGLTTTKGMSQETSDLLREHSSARTPVGVTVSNGLAKPCAARSFGDGSAPRTEEPETSCDRSETEWHPRRLLKIRNDVEVCTVYDLVNVGTRNRFMVLTDAGPILAHNCGYQGHVGAFQSMAKVYGVKVPDEQAAEIVNAWRNKNGAIVNLWYGLERAAWAAVKNHGELAEFRGIKYQYRDGFLVCRLPSGRCLFYAAPHFRMVERTIVERVDSGMLDEKGEVIYIEKKKKVIKEALCFWGVSQKERIVAGTPRWGVIPTYGGKLCENVVQAVSRDLLTEAMLRSEAEGFTPVLHVHDEIVAEAYAGLGGRSEQDNLKYFCDLMAELPEWATGLPVAADGWVGRRYRK